MKPRVLYVTHRVPFPPDRGDRIRTWNLLKFLAARADIDLACLADEPVTDTVRRQITCVTRRFAVVPHTGPRRYLSGMVSLLRGGSITEGMFRSRALTRILRTWNQDTLYDAALASSSGTAPFILPPNVSVQGQRWVDLIDVDSQKWMDYAAASRGPLSAVYRCEGRRLRTLETRLAERTDRLLVVTEAERSLFHSFCPQAPVQAVANGVDVEFFSPGCDRVQPRSCVFVGVMNYRPNVDAVCWFAEHVWPSVRQRWPDARFHIVGRSPAPDVSALNRRDGITVTGAVPDVRPWLHRAACVVVPLRIARGVQNKVLEAMACARPVVCSSAPLQGLAVEPGLHVLKADAPGDWQRAVGEIFEDENRAQELGLAASAWVQMHHRWDRCLEPVYELLEQPRAAVISETSS